MNFKINGTLQKTAGAKWSATDKCWYVPLTRGNYEKIIAAVKNVVDVDDSLLRLFL